MEKDDLHGDLKSLGDSAGNNYNYKEPDFGLLEKFPSPFSLEDHNPAGCQGSIQIVCPEFTSLCPKTGQPDFAVIKIDYTPAGWCVESKSLKMYFMSFRNHGEFHESCINRICNDLVQLLDPVEMWVKGEFTPRGGIPFWPTATWRRPEADENNIEIGRQ